MQNQIHIVDDDEPLRDSLSILMESRRIHPIIYETGDAFLKQDISLITAPILLDIRMPGKDGIEVLEEALKQKKTLKIIMMSGHADIATAVKAVKLGAIDFIEKPFRDTQVFPLIEAAQMAINETLAVEITKQELKKRLAKLTPRETEIMESLADGHPNKAIANALGVSVRTVETHRAHLMTKLDIKSVSELVKIYLTSK